jgi:4-carboxymuconolactone decarboxylase
MARYETLTPEQMTPEQRKVVDNVTAGPRGSATRGPFMAWLPSPKFADLAQALGAQTRFGSSLPAKHYEIAILMVAQQWRAQFEWYAHAQLARKAGISQGIIDAIHRGEKPHRWTRRKRRSGSSPRNCCRPKGCPSRLSPRQSSCSARTAWSIWSA